MSASGPTADNPPLGGALADAASWALVGREGELARLHGMIDRISDRGESLVLRGEAGIGKSALMRGAEGYAGHAGMLVLRAAGVESETSLPFATLHQLLRPVLRKVEGLPVAMRNAIGGAFGLSEVTAPDPYRIALAVLHLLSDLASRSPVLVAVDEAQWADRPSVDALAFVARRVESDPIIVLIAVRDGAVAGLIDGGLPELPLSPLDPDASEALLDGHARGLPSTTRQRLLREAAGNPLALIELPAGLRSGNAEGDITSRSLPLTRRLERAFAGRLPELPADTRAALVAAAVDDSDELDEVLRAATISHGSDVGPDAIEPGIDVGLVELHGPRLRFRHPLVRSAIHQASTGTERRQSHAALATILEHDPDRRAWHRAAAVVGSDPSVAVDLDQVATRARRRGAHAVALAALGRAAALDDTPAVRGRRLLDGAEIAFELGQRETVTRLLGAADLLALQPLDRGRMAWIREIFDDGGPGGASQVAELVRLGKRAAREGDRALALNFLRAAALRCFWGNPGEPTGRRVADAALQVEGMEGSPWLVSVLALADPIGRGRQVRDALTTFKPSSTDAFTARLLGGAAFVTGDHPAAVPFLEASVDGMRAQGRLALLAQTLVLQAWNALLLGDWTVAAIAAEEARALARETTQPVWAAATDVARAILHGLRGEADSAMSLAADAERAILPTKTNALLAIIQMARGLTGLAQGRNEEAFAELRRMFDPDDPSYHLVIRGWVLGDLAEAAKHSGQQTEARRLVRNFEPIVASEAASPLMRVAAGLAEPLLADEAEAGEKFEAAMKADLTAWPFHRARLNLAYGSWLRRNRRVIESRVPLRAARDAFDSLGGVAWGERARQELRAAGERSGRRRREAWDQLSPQELQVARLASHGLSNREIGDRLFLSPRTAAYHLYKIFPKLGVTSRAQLHDALAAQQNPVARGAHADERAPGP